MIRGSISMNTRPLLRNLIAAAFVLTYSQAFTVIPSSPHEARAVSPLKKIGRARGAALHAYEYALLFDCDGVILETEELHRLAYNHAFEQFDLKIDGEPVVWSVEYYDKLQNTVGGGKPKMFYHFRTTMEGRFPTVGAQPAPQTPEEQQKLIDDLQEYKTNHFKTLLETEAKARPGVLELMDAALADPTTAVGVCSAATKAAAVKTLDITLGQDRVKALNVCILGDDVSEKKPHPMIYNVARERLGMTADQCVVIEDSLVGLRAAVSANMKCIITYTASTASADFYGEGAAAKVPDLATAGVTLDSIFQPLRQSGPSAEILIGKKD
jgi:HAD superfamily hydrolase (TIGR01509 family)